MNKNNKLRNYIATSILTLILLCVYAYYSYQKSYSASKEKIDSHLKMAVQTTDIILGQSFHNRTFDAATVSFEQYLNTAKKLTEFAQLSGLDYVYTMVIREAKIYFVSSSLTPETYAAGEVEEFYWMHYEEAPQELYELFSQKGSRFIEYEDRWGQYRSLFQAKVADNGEVYVIGADISLTELQAIKQNALLNLSISSIFLVVVIALWGVTLRSNNKELSVSERRKSLALSAGSIAIWEWQIDREELFISPSLFVNLGFADTEIPKSSEEIIAIIDDRDRQAFFDRIKAIKNCVNFEVYRDEFHFRIKSPKGKEVWLYSRGETVAWDKQGNPILMAGVLENITKAKHFELALLSSNEKVKARATFIGELLNSLPDMVSYKDEHGAYRICNSTIEAVFGKPAADILGRTDADFFPVHVAENFRSNDLKAMSLDEETVVREWMYDSSKSKNRLIETKKRKVSSPYDDSVGVLSVGRDITDNHYLLAELNRYKRFIDDSTQGLLIASMDFEVQFVNPTMKKILSTYNNADIVGRYLKNIEAYDDQFIEKVEAEVLPLVRGGESWSGEVVVGAHNGRGVQTIHTIFMILSDKQVPTSIGIIVTDITQQKNIESELVKQKLRADRASESKSLFLANMSHEIRTPLNAVIGFSQVLEAMNNLDDQARGYVAKIYNAGNRLLSLINEILDLSKIEAGKLVLKPTKFSIKTEMLNTATMFVDLAKNKNLGYEYELNLASDLMVYLDCGKLNQIIINLLNNAIKYTAHGQVSFKCDYSDGILSFVISDSGDGMSASELQRLFTPFEQGESGLGSGGGAGLGLALTKRLVEAMNGSIDINSNVGEGTTVELKIPVSKTELQVKHERPKANGPDDTQILGGVRALVIDDDPDSLDVLESMLVKIGFNVVKQAEPTLAINMMESEEYDIVFTDIRMPHVNGIEVLQKIRTKNLSKFVIAVSASSMLHERQQYIDEGFDDFVSKPVELSELIERLCGIGKLRFKHSIKLTHGENSERSPASEDAKITASEELHPLTEKDIQLLKNTITALDEGDFDSAEEWVSALSGELQKASLIQHLLKQMSNYSANAAIDTIKGLFAQSEGVD